MRHNVTFVERGPGEGQARQAEKERERVWGRRTDNRERMQDKKKKKEKKKRKKERKEGGGKRRRRSKQTNEMFEQSGACGWWCN